MRISGAEDPRMFEVPMNCPAMLREKFDILTTSQAGDAFIGEPGFFAAGGKVAD